MQDETTQTAQHPDYEKYSSPHENHGWLRKLVGEWDVESEMAMAPGEPVEKYAGTETVRMLGDLWAVCESRSAMPGGVNGEMMMTIGYDKMKNRFVGSWVGSMMTMMWIYDGELDGDRLTLGSTGPSMTEEGATGNFRDVIEFQSDDERTMTSYAEQPDGSWEPFMTVRSRRRK